MARLMFLEADLGRLLNAASNGKVGRVGEFNFKEEHEVLKMALMFEQEELRVTVGQEAKIQHAPQRGLTQVVRIPVSVLRQPDFRNNDIQAGDELHLREQVRLIGVKAR
jgi:hypothetical protein